MGDSRDKLVRKILHQAYDGGTQRGCIDVYAEAWCLRDVELAEWLELEKFMVDAELIVESGPTDMYQITRKGESFMEGS